MVVLVVVLAVIVVVRRCRERVWNNRKREREKKILEGVRRINPTV